MSALEEDIEYMEIVRALYQIPNYKEFTKYALHSNKAMAAIKNVKAWYLQYGVLNFGKLAEDKLVKFKRDEDDLVVIPTLNTEENEFFTDITFGQHDTNTKKLNGIGRKIRIFA